jgi:CRP/FNR family cyclic AMP-dependent transcriptional regulator
MQAVDRAAATSVVGNLVLFGGLSADEREALLPRLRRRAFRAGATVFMRGDPGQDLYVVESGSVKICLTTEQGKEITLAILGQGEFFGELALLDGQPRSSDAVAMEPTQCLLLERTEFLHFIEHRPRVALLIIDVLISSLLE